MFWLGTTGSSSYSDTPYSDISKWVMQWVRVRIRARDRVRVRLRLGLGAELVLVAPFQKHLPE